MRETKTDQEIVDELLVTQSGASGSGMTSPMHRCEMMIMMITMARKLNKVRSARALQANEATAYACSDYSPRSTG